MSETSGDDSVLMSIISSALELRDEGIEPPIEELCAGHEELMPAVLEAMGLAQDLPKIQARGHTKDLFLGRVLRGRYRLDLRLGAGAMGVVYAGEDLELHRSVAVKILRTDVLGADEAEYRFIREAEVMAAVQHSAVITVYDRGTTETDEHYLVMELLEGESLNHILEKGRRRAVSRSVEDTDWIARALKCDSFPDHSYLRTIVQWAADLASGLSAAHEAGVYHRDVKPSNVFIKKDGSALLLDFGIAASTEHATLMRDSGALGTPAYMAPESLDASKPASAALDIYSLSATLYHMLVLRAPYSGSPSQIIASLKDRDPRPAYKLRKGLPRDLQAILDRGMARRPSQRYSTAEELEADLRAFLEYRPVSARPITAAGRVWRRLRRSPAFFAASAVAVGALALAGEKEWSTRREQHFQGLYADANEHVPPSLTLGPIPYRKDANPERRQVITELLDSCVKYRSAPIPALLLRGSYRLDQGDLQGALDDMRTLADGVGTEYARELTKRYEQLEEGTTGGLALQLDGLPEPKTAEDSYLSGFHSIRIRGDVASARKIFETPLLATYSPAQELLILCIEHELRGLPREKRKVGSIENYERAVRLEEQVGRRTATTAHLIGLTLMTAERYAKAIGPLRDGVELAENSYGLNLNLGIVARRLLQREESKRHLERAIELCPKLLSPHETLVRLYVAFDELELAEQVIEQAPFARSKAGRATRLQLEGDVEFARTLALYESGRKSSAQTSAENAIEYYEESRSLSGEDEPSLQQQICEAIAVDRPQDVVTPLLKLLKQDPLRWRRLSTFLDWMPNTFNEEHTRALREYIVRLIEALEPKGY